MRTRDAVDETHPLAILPSVKGFTRRTMRDTRCAHHGVGVEELRRRRSMCGSAFRLWLSRKCRAARAWASGGVVG